MTLEDFIRLHSHRIWSDRTLKDNLKKLEKVCCYSGYGKRDISTFTASDVYLYLDTLLADGRAPATVNRYTAALSKVFKLAKDMRLIEHCLLYTSPSPRDPKTSRMPSSA